MGVLKEAIDKIEELENEIIDKIEELENEIVILNNKILDKEAENDFIRQLNDNISKKLTTLEQKVNS